MSKALFLFVFYLFPFYLLPAEGRFNLLPAAGSFGFKVKNQI